TRFKGLGAAFPRRIIRFINNEQTLAGGVEWEVRYILRAHFGHLPNCDANFERAICGGLPESKFDWRAYEQSHPALYLTSKEEKLKLRELRIPRKADKQTKADRKKLRAEFLRNKLVLSSHFEGGVLFGQAVPRFDNRIISTCPITGEKVPSKSCVEFHKFRWAMTLANIRVAGSGEKELRSLTADERKKINAVMESEGALTPTELKKAVRETTHCSRDNLDTMLMHPDAKEALLLDPIQKLVHGDKLKTLWPTFSPRVQKRARDLWQRGKPVTLERICGLAQKLGESTDSFEAELNKLADAANAKRSKKAGSFNREALLKETLTIKKSDGRAAYARPLLVRAHAEVMAGKHPKEEGGCLFITEEMRQAQLQKQIDQQTNNHLVRHRLLILERLLKDLIAEPAFANGDPSRIAKVTIEVNRDLREMSGMDSIAKKNAMREKLGNIRAVEKYVLDRLPEKYHSRVNGSFLRKARVADDLGWRCPYTGEMIQPIHFITGVVELDHVIPYAMRPSNSLDSLVATFSVVNKMKRKQTAVQFMKAMDGKSVCIINEKGQTEKVDGMPNLSLLQFRDFKVFVDKLKIRGAGEHEQDKERRLRRKRLLEIENYEQKEFLPRDLTQTSQLARLGAQVLRKNLPHLTTGNVTSLPGSVTGTVRKGWNLLGCLATAAPQVKEADGSIKNKTDIRNLTHLHHALDACVLGLASHYLPNNGGLWEVMIKRNPNDADKALLRSTGYFDFDSEGRFGLTELPDALKEQIRQRLAEKRVVQHIPADMSGMRVEENTRSAVLKGNGKYDLNPPHDKGALPVKKLVGLQPTNGNGKLKPQRGVRVITDNFGVAVLDNNPEQRFQIIPWFKVWPRLYKGIGDEKSLVEQNGGKPPRILRNGMLIRIGKFRVLKPTRILENSVWMVDSIGDFDGVIKADLKPCDVVNTRFEGIDPTDPLGKKKKKFTTAGCKLSTDLERVYEGGLEILENSLTGVPTLPPEDSAGCTSQKNRYATHNEIAIRSAGATDRGGHSSGSRSEPAPLQSRAKFLQNWDWASVAQINGGLCERSRAQRGANSETHAAV
ncbi:MAG: type II CRISPR RNA-guided endonuclease Cas9, partial [Verrucomicrobiota bacterium]